MYFTRTCFMYVARTFELWKCFWNSPHRENLSSASRTCWSYRPESSRSSNVSPWIVRTPIRCWSTTWKLWPEFLTQEFCSPGTCSVVEMFLSRTVVCNFLELTHLASNPVEVLKLASSLAVILDPVWYGDFVLECHAIVLKFSSPW